MEGFVQTSRDLYDNWIWRDAKHLKWFMDLVYRASWQDRVTEIQGRRVELKRGQQIVSVRLLQKRWADKNEFDELSNIPARKTIERFLSRLEEHSIIKRNKSDHQFTILTICKYALYGTEIGVEVATPVATPVATMGDNKEYRNIEIREKGNKEINKETVSDDTVKKVPVKKHYAEFVTMTEEEYSKLVLQFGQEQTTWMINKLDNYKGSKGKTYKSDYRAILSWVAKEYESNKNQTRTVNYGAEYANNAIGREAAREAAREQRRKEAYEWIANEINRCNAV